MGKGIFPEKPPQFKGVYTGDVSSPYLRKRIDESDCIISIGDGSFQVTAQELSTILRQNLKPIIFLIKNNGYTVERAIYGQNESYNDIQMWYYTKLANVFGLEKKV